MMIHLNGRPREVAAATLADLVAAEDVRPEVVATALNGDFVPRDRRASTPLSDGDRVEIVAPRQGG